MRVAIPVEGPDRTAEFGRVFGRAPYFLFAETDTGAWTVEPNPGAQATGGAGTEAARFVLDHDVQAVIAPRVGPKAQAVLDGAGIRVTIHQGGTAAAALEAFAE